MSAHNKDDLPNTMQHWCLRSKILHTDDADFTDDRRFFSGMEKKQHIMVSKFNKCCMTLHPVRDESLGRIAMMCHNKPYPVRDASLTGCKRWSLLNFLPSDTFLWNVSREKTLPGLRQKVYELYGKSDVLRLLQCRRTIQTNFKFERDTERHFKCC